MKKHEKPAGRETAYQSAKRHKNAQDKSKSAQPRDHSLAGRGRAKGTGDRNKEMHHA